MPGEIVSREAIDFLQQAIAQGGTITGCSDPKLETLTVVSDESLNAG
jgi:arginine decarboxylase